MSDCSFNGCNAGLVGGVVSMTAHPGHFECLRCIADGVSATYGGFVAVLKGDALAVGSVVNITYSTVNGLLVSHR